MRRGEIWTVAAPGDYTRKPRPMVIVQSDMFDATQSLTMCGFTSDRTEAPLLRLPVEPSPDNGLRETSRLMVDKVSTVPKTRLDRRIGRLSDTDVTRLNRALLVFLGLAGETAPRAAAPL